MHCLDAERTNIELKLLKPSRFYYSSVSKYLREFGICLTRPTDLFSDP